MAMEVMSKKLLDAVMAKLEAGTPTKDVKKSLREKFDLSENQIDRYLGIALAKEKTNKYGTNPQLLEKAGLPWKAWLRAR